MRKLKVYYSCSNFTHHNHKYKFMATICGKIQKFIWQLLGINEMVEKLAIISKSLNVAVDIHYKHDNWAVVCLQGNPCYINLLRLGKQDIQEVKRFLKQYKDANIFIDHPPGFIL